MKTEQHVNDPLRIGGSPKDFSFVVFEGFQLAHYVARRNMFLSSLAPCGHTT